MPREVMAVKRSEMQVGLRIFGLVPLIFSQNAENLKNVLKKQVLAGKKTKPKMERWVRMLNEENSKKPLPSRKTKRKKILEILNKNSEIGWSEILCRVNAPAQTLRELKEEGVIEIYEKRVYRRFLDGRPPEI